MRELIRCVRPQWRLPALTIFLLTQVYAGFGQPNLYGKIITEQTKEPLPNVNVQLMKAADSSLIFSVVTDSKGEYTIPAKGKGTFYLLITHTGYAAVQTRSFRMQGDLDLGITVLAASEKTLQTVTVLAKKEVYEQKTDRMIVRVDGSISAAGNGILDILARTPGVLVNQQTNSISIAGKTGVVLMIDDKIIRAASEGQVVQLLAGINSGNVEKIEVITVPPVNLEAEGNAGYIHIVTKKNLQYGTNGSYSLALAYSRGFVEDGSINFNNRDHKLNLFGDLSATHRRAAQYFTFYHQSSDDGIVSDVLTEVPRQWTQTTADGKLGLDYTIDDRTIAGVMVSGFANLLAITSNGTGTNSVNGQIDTIMQLYDNEIHNTYNLNANLNLEHRVNAKDRLIFNLDYVHAKDINPVGYYYTFLDSDRRFLYDNQFRTKKETPMDTWILKTDYSMKLSPHSNLETGVQGTMVRFINTVNAVSYRLNENYPAAYANLLFNPGDKTNLVLGLRYEYTNSNLGNDTLKNIVDRHYGDLFPVVSVNRTIDAFNSFSLAYNRRITRPKIWDMAPFVIYFDPYTYFSGNPALQPGIIDNVEMNYTWKNYVFHFSYSYEKNSIANFFPAIDSATNIETFSSRNLQFTRTLSAVITIPIRVNAWWTMSNALTATWHLLKTSYDGSPVELSQKMCKIQTTQTFLLPGHYSLEISGYYQSPAIMFFYEIAPMGDLDIHFQKKIERIGVFQIVAQNILNTDYWHLSINEPSLNLVSRLNLRFSYPVFKVNFSRSFGHKKIKESRIRSTGSEDIMDRIK